MNPAGNASNMTETGDKTQAAKNIATIDMSSEEERFKSAPKHSRLNLVSNLKRCDSFNTGKKRKVLDASMDWGQPGSEAVKRVEDPITFVVREAMESIIKTSTVLERRISENPNTKREIKELALGLKKGAEVLRRDTTKSWLDFHRWQKVEIPKYEVECQTQGDGKGKTYRDM